MLCVQQVYEMRNTYDRHTENVVRHTTGVLENGLRSYSIDTFEGT